MYSYEDEILESVFGNLLSDDTDAIDSVEEASIDVDDEMSIIEAAVDIEIAEACKKEACKKEACKKEACKKEGCGKGSSNSGKICEKCGKPIEQCEC